MDSRCKQPLGKIQKNGRWVPHSLTKLNMGQRFGFALAMQDSMLHHQKKMLPEMGSFISSSIILPWSYSIRCLSFAIISTHLGQQFKTIDEVNDYITSFFGPKLKSFFLNGISYLPEVWQILLRMKTTLNNKSLSCSKSFIEELLKKQRELLQPTQNICLH